jgi:hypothetical protein
VVTAIKNDRSVERHLRNSREKYHENIVIEDKKKNMGGVTIKKYIIDLNIMKTEEKFDNYGCPE